MLVGGLALNAEGICQLLITSQVLLAVANGAWLVQPSWLTASMEAGHWADEQSHCAQVHLNT